jgi:Zn-dependent peptidase ImmA (M78 family)
VDWSSAHRIGLLAATRRLRRLGIDTTRWIDIIDVLGREELVVAFRPTPRLSGAYLAEPGRQPGVLINSNHPLQRQRYTAAHEYGHHSLGHATTVDEDLARGVDGPLPDHEKTAEAFASWFLMPHSLVRRCLSALDVQRPRSGAELYQLSLRMGVSYEATARHLGNMQLLSRTQVNRALTAAPVRLKSRLGARELGAQGRDDIWLLSERDSGLGILARPGSWIILELEEIPSSGYAWIPRLPAWMSIVRDTWDDGFLPPFARDREEGNAAVAPGDAAMRYLVLSVGADADDAEATLALDYAQPWAPDSVDRSMAVPVTIRGSQLGVPERQLRLASA